MAKLAAVDKRSGLAFVSYGVNKSRATKHAVRECSGPPSKFRIRPPCNRPNIYYITQRCAHGLGSLWRFIDKIRHYRSTLFTQSEHSSRGFRGLRERLMFYELWHGGDKNCEIRESICRGALITGQPIIVRTYTSAYV